MIIVKVSNIFCTTEKAFDIVCICDCVLCQHNSGKIEVVVCMVTSFTLGILYAVFNKMCLIKF